MSLRPQECVSVSAEVAWSSSCYILEGPFFGRTEQQWLVSGIQQLCPARRLASELCCLDLDVGESLPHTGPQFLL